MRAIRFHEFGEPDVMKVMEAPDPQPGPGEVVVDLRAAGVNPVDTYIRSGLYRPDLPLPCTPGIDGAGIISVVKEQGAHHVLNHREEGYLDSISELTCGRGIDVVVEMLANVNLGNDLALLASGGRVVVVGSRGTVEIDPRKAFLPESSILGMSLYSATEKELQSMHAAFAAGLVNGTLRPIVSREFPLKEAAAAHRAVMGESTLGKIVLVP